MSVNLNVELGGVGGPYNQLVAGEVQEVLQNCSLSGRVSDGKYYVHVQAVRKLAI